jgi:hypothetical protein
MKPKVPANAKERLKRLSEQTKPKRGKISLYLSTDLYTKFQEACGEVPVYKVIEDFMQEFIDDLKKGK